MCVRLCECVSVCPQGGDTKITFPPPPPLRNEAADFASTAACAARRLLRVR